VLVASGFLMYPRYLFYTSLAAFGMFFPVHYRYLFLGNSSGEKRVRRKVKALIAVWL